MMVQVYISDEEVTREDAQKDKRSEKNLIATNFTILYIGFTLDLLKRESYWNLKTSENQHDREKDISKVRGK